MENLLIVSDPNVSGAKPIVAGTRITVAFILDSLAAGRTNDQLRTAHPELTDEVFEAAKGFVLEAVRQNTIDTYRIPVCIRHLIVALQPNGLVTRIVQAFDNVALGHGPSLRQMRVMDNYGCDEQGQEMPRKDYVALRSLDETTNWAALTVDDLNKYDYLAYADGESFRFYIPALMIEAIARQGCEEVVSRLSPPKQGAGLWEYHMMQYALLNDLQKAAIAHFLWYLLDSYELKLDYGQTGKESEKALDQYWMPFLEPREERPLPKRKTRRK
jgi:uncharacterized protein (DUF433 family)